MSNLKFDIDVDALSKVLQGVEADLKKDLLKGAENLATMTHAKTLELAGEELSSLAKTYKDNVQFSNPAEGLWVVTLLEPALWIEEGRKAGFMEELLNTVKPGKAPAKQGKNGKYRVIPFQHNINPTEQSPKAYDLAQTIKHELKKQGVNWKKIETDEHGSPRIGLIHRFDFDTARPTDAQKDIHKTSLTKGVAVYQRKDETGKVRKEVMTFRVISEKHRGEGLWNHPGRPGNKLMDKALEWATATWEKDILPTIFEKYKGK